MSENETVGVKNTLIFFQTIGFTATLAEAVLFLKIPNNNQQMSHNIQ